MNKKDIVLSAATVASAISAIGQLGQSGIHVSIEPGGNEYTRIVQNAIAGSQAQRQIKASTLTVANALKLDGELLSQRYMRIAQGDGGDNACQMRPWMVECGGDGVDPNDTPDPDPEPDPEPTPDPVDTTEPSPTGDPNDPRHQFGPLEADSTVDFFGGSNYAPSGFGCYTNCHSACHGSRGWR